MIASRALIAALLIAVALMVAACDSTAETTTTTIVTGTTTAPTTEAAAAEPPPEEPFTYTIGIPTDIIPGSSLWAAYGPGDVLEYQVFGPTEAALFRIAYPGLVVSPNVAVGLPAAAVQEGEVWTVTQPMRDDFTWSDGSLLTADDVVFTYETVRGVGLDFNWPVFYPYLEESAPRLLSVEAIDRFTVRYTFDAKPGAATWPHAVGVAPIMPRAPWESLVTEALQSDDPAAAIYAADAYEVGDLSGGPLVYNGRVEGESIENIRNEHYANEGFTHQFWDDGSYALNGKLLYGQGTGDPSVEYTEGPYLDRTEFTIYSGEQGGILELVDGKIDYMVRAATLSPTVRRQGLEADNLAVMVNPINGWNYLAFNLRRSPGKFVGFRQAMAYFDKESLANEVLQGAFTPVYVLVPEGNQAWYDEEIAEEVRSRYVGLSTNERLAAAYEALEADGFTWETQAVFDEEGNLVSPGEGLVDPDGNAVQDLQIFNTGSGFKPEQFATALWLEEWAESLGIPAEAEPADFGTIVANVWPGVGVEPTFDMYLFQWTVGNPAWPTFHESFFHTRNLAETNDRNNSTGYSNPDFDALADAMLTETDQAVAFDQVWQMERMIADDLPYVVLFSAPHTEFYNQELRYPFTQTLSGLINLAGMQGMVDK